MNFCRGVERKPGLRQGPSLLELFQKLQAKILANRFIPEDFASTSEDTPLWSLGPSRSHRAVLVQPDGSYARVLKKDDREAAEQAASFLLGPDLYPASEIDEHG